MRSHQIVIGFLIKTLPLIILFIANSASAGSCNQVLANTVNSLSKRLILIQGIKPNVSKFESLGKTKLERSLREALAARNWRNSSSEKNILTVLNGTFYSFVNRRGPNIVLTPILNLVIDRLVTSLELSDSESDAVKKALREKTDLIEEHYAYYGIQARSIVAGWDLTRALATIDTLNFLAEAFSGLSETQLGYSFPLDSYSAMTNFLVDIGLRPWNETTSFGSNVIATTQAEVNSLRARGWPIMANSLSHRSFLKEVDLALEARWPDYLSIHFRGRVHDDYGIKGMFDQIIDRIQWLGVFSEQDLLKLKVEMFTLGFNILDGSGLSRGYNKAALERIIKGLTIVSTYYLKARMRSGLSLEETELRSNRIYEPEMLLKFLKEIGFTDSYRVVDSSYSLLPGESDLTSYEKEDQRFWEKDWPLSIIEPN